MDNNKKTFKQRAIDLWHYFSTYEKIWFFSILVLAIAFTFIFPETDDPTYTVELNQSSYVQSDDTFDTLDFTGTENEFTIYQITINDKEYAISEFTKVKEFTVSPDDEDSLKLKLPTAVKSTDSISFECLPEGDEATMTLTVTNENGTVLYKDRIDLESSQIASFSVKENAPKYLVSVTFLMILYLLDTITNIACELLISKQSKWNFIVSLLVEVIEIVICIVCAYRFATLAVTLLFWIPCDIISFIMWNKNPDKEDKELTIVKSLTPLQDVLVVLGIIVWTIVIGYLLTFIEVDGGIFANNVMYKNIACYLDACVSAVGIANGLFILFRYREQWIAWYISAILETVINIMAGQYVLLVLKAGYLTNTTYGYIKWTKYIKSHKKANAENTLAKTE